MFNPTLKRFKADPELEGWDDQFEDLQYLCHHCGKRYAFGGGYLYRAGLTRCACNRLFHNDIMLTTTDNKSGITVTPRHDCYSEHLKHCWTQIDPLKNSVSCMKQVTGEETAKFDREDVDC